MQGKLRISNLQNNDEEWPIKRYLVVYPKWINFSSILTL
jgi:hypothetical protein